MTHTIPFTCPYCGASRDVSLEYSGRSGPCADCGNIITIPGLQGRSPFAARPAYEPDAATRMLLPVGRSLWAIAAGYLGLFSLIPFFAPLAVVVSIVAIVRIKKNPKLHGMGRAVFGLVMGGLVSALLLFFLIAAAVAS